MLHLCVADATPHTPSFQVFHAADSQPLETSHWLGPFTLTLAVFFDAMTPNVEEMMLRRMGRCKQEMILVTQGLRALVSGITVASTGELMSGHRWLASQKTWQPLGLLALQALVAYAGIYLYLVLLMNAGSKVHSASPSLFVCFLTV